MASSQPQQINVADLDIQQLSDVRRQLEEVDFFLPSSLDRISKRVFTQPGIKSLDQFLRPTQAGAIKIQVLPRKRCRDTTILVPLTNSLYVPGKLSDTEHVIVDVGTGYYVKKVNAFNFDSSPADRFQTRAEATKYYKAKVDFIHGNLETLSETIQKKQDNMNYLMNVMQAKLQVQVQGSSKSPS
ncbi:Prefoldin-domain-containing protein [Chiua virens]|nr:Prefoldin-domain-containing protein [Chiua virens]